LPQYVPLSSPTSSSHEGSAVPKQPSEVFISRRFSPYELATLSLVQEQEEQTPFSPWTVLHCVETSK
jgi:hypothetical protein